MIKLTFKHRGYNRVVEFKEETYQSIYYQLAEMFNPGEPTANNPSLYRSLRPLVLDIYHNRLVLR